MCSCKRHGDQNAPCTCNCPHPTPTTPTPDDAARAEADRLWFSGQHGSLADWRGGYVHGRADERARIAARRDKVAEAIYSHVPTWRPTTDGADIEVVPLAEVEKERKVAVYAATDDVLAALEVDRG